MRTTTKAELDQAIKAEIEFRLILRARSFSKHVQAFNKSNNEGLANALRDAARIDNQFHAEMVRRGLR